MCPIPTPPPIDGRRRRGPKGDLIDASADAGGPGIHCAHLRLRGMLKVRHVPEQLLDVTVTPVMFVLMFTYISGDAHITDIAIVLGVAAALTAVFAPLTTRLYRRG